VDVLVVRDAAPSVFEVVEAPALRLGPARPNPFRTATAGVYFVRVSDPRNVSTTRIVLLR
jgi:hypothetical protein